MNIIYVMDSLTVYQENDNLEVFQDVESLEIYQENDSLEGENVVKATLLLQMIEDESASI